MTRLLLALKQSPSLALTLVLALLLLLLGLFPGWSEPLFEFNRDRIATGEVWRLLTGQLVHYGYYHLAMNLAALLLCGYVLLQDLSLRDYSLLLLISGLCVGLGLYTWDTQLDFYAGLSGVLHGLILGGLLRGLRGAPVFYGLALVVVIGKLVQEQLPGFDASHPLLPVPVAVNAHLYGAAGGLIWAMITVANRWFVLQRR